MERTDVISLSIVWTSLSGFDHPDERSEDCPPPCHRFSVTLPGERLFSVAGTSDLQPLLDPIGPSGNDVNVRKEIWDLSGEKVKE